MAITIFAGNFRDAAPGERLPRPAMILVDLDGTMVDSAPDLAYCVDSLLPRLGLPKRGEARVRLWVGNGVERLLHRALTNEINGVADPDLYAKAWSGFMELYAANTSTRSRIYAGVREGLDKLVALGFPMACVTNKSARFTIPLLNNFGLSDYFRLVIAGDTLPQQKPDPMPLLHAARHFRIPAERCLMVGDSINDILAARAAHFFIACVSYGYNHGIDIRMSGPDAVVDSLEELTQLLMD
ncbi:Phosphoglycolate phosphatase [Gammaproteobacteria bacterium]